MTRQRFTSVQRVLRGLSCTHRRMRYRRCAHCSRACRVECPDCGLSEQLPDESNGDMEEIPNVTIHGVGNRAFALSEADGSLNCWQTVEEVDDEIEEDDDDPDNTDDWIVDDVGLGDPT